MSCRGFLSVEHWALYACINMAYRSGSDLIYGFNKFACSLNELEEGVAPTDCRLRPDIRIMEEQDFNGANSEKVFTDYIMQSHTPLLNSG